MTGKRLTKRQMMDIPCAEFSIPFTSNDGPVSGMTWTGLLSVATLEGKFNPGPEYLLHILEQTAKAGDKQAAQRLAYIALDLATTLENLAQTKPDLLKPYARQCHAWPVAAMKKEMQNERVKKLFSQIELGADAMVELDAQTAKWKLDRAGEIAYALLEYVNAARLRPKRYGKFGRQAKALKPFCDDSCGDWWKLALTALLNRYPKPQNEKELELLVTSPSKRRSPGRVRQAIFDILKARFCSFAPNLSYQTSAA
jgi:hypothetical protein